MSLKIFLIDVPYDIKQDAKGHKEFYYTDFVNVVHMFIERQFDTSVRLYINCTATASTRLNNSKMSHKSCGTHSTCTHVMCT